MSNVDQFSSYISENAHSISREIVEYVVDHCKPLISDEEKEMALSMYVKLLDFYSESLKNKDENFIPDHLIEWSKNNAQMQVSNGGKLSDIIVRYPLTRDVATEIVIRISLEIGLTTVDTATVLKGINQILDVSLNETVFAFEQLSEQAKQELQEELISLSAPIVPVHDEVVVIPLIGYIDEDRAAFIMDSVIPQIAEMNVDYVILDFSGVMTINGHVAESLHQIGSVFRIMGINIIITGLRPELVQVAISSNIRISSAYAFSTVKQALENIGK
ncbi:STAS domain-containing protein [Planomicrobium okeanokoites]|uniref:STAS domain-containing protein n=1 Tax=Planomicrobium okeanokoites TaxID=244 RepID=A0ABV7KH43_PLAOK|nr:STAS domain-containing protein [Planomicrobium okeanokoites]TAA68850.1 STAS domain-containing protein [Planomicrobium okeanokoites]